MRILGILVLPADHLVRMTSMFLAAYAKRKLRPILEKTIALNLYLHIGVETAADSDPELKS